MVTLDASISLQLLTKKARHQLAWTFEVGSLLVLHERLLVLELPVTVVCGSESKRKGSGSDRWWPHPLNPCLYDLQQKMTSAFFFFRTIFKF
jgi:hypothetical protein